MIYGVRIKVLGSEEKVNNVVCGDGSVHASY